MTADVAALFLTGLVSLFGQIILLRELDVAFYGIELIYLIALGVWMILTAVGALIGGRSPSAGRTAVLFLCFALFLPLGVVFLRASRLLMGGVPGAYLPFPRKRKRDAAAAIRPQATARGKFWTPYRRQNVASTPPARPPALSIP